MPRTPSPRRALARPTLTLLLATFALLALTLSANAPTVAAVQKCNTKTLAPSTITPSVDEYAEDVVETQDHDDDDDVGAENEAGVLAPVPTVKPSKTPKPTKTKKVKTPKPSKTPKPGKTPKPSTLTPAAADAENTVDPTSLPSPAPAPAAMTKRPVAPAATTKTPSISGGNSTRPSSGKCVTGDPTQYISKQYVDWIWENRMKKNFDTFTNFIFDQLMANIGKLSYCIRWDSTNKLPKATAVKFKTMLDRQYAQWNKWLVGYGCWPFATIELEMVGVAVRDKALLDWTDESLGPIYENMVDSDGIPMCPEACYKHRNFEKSSDTSACKGKPFDISLWPTLGQGGGAGGDWGQRVDEANMLSSLDGDSSVIVAHEIGHGFGLPDFYQENEKPGPDMPKMIMEAGASMSVTEGDGWLIRRGWENVRKRWPSTSG